MNTKDIDNKIPIYQLDSKEKVLKYYVNWTKKGEYNKNMVEWNYQAPQNAAKLFNKYAPNKDINIFKQQAQYHIRLFQAFLFCLFAYYYTASRTPCQEKRCFILFYFLFDFSI